MRERCALSAIVAMLTAGLTVAQDFTIIGLPDTQNYSQDFPATYFAQTQWIVDNIASRNIVFVSHYGDVVNVGTDPAEIYQWDNARAAMNTLDQAGVPNGVCVGNHDIWGTDGGGFTGDGYDPDGTNFLLYFGPQHYESNAWWAGASPSGLSSAQLLQVAPGRRMLFLHLLIETPAAELAWAQTILNAHADVPCMVTTHRYLFDWRVLGQGRYDDFNYTFEPLYRHDGIKSNDFWTYFIKPNRQIFWVNCGHCDGEYRQTSTNNAGLPVHEVLADYQTTYGNGGNGYLRTMTFRPDVNQVEVQTYSPTLGSYRTGDESDFVLGVNLDDYVAGYPRLRFQQGASGYTGAVDTYLSEDAPSSSFGNALTLFVDDDIANSWFSDRQAQALLRFDELFQGPVVEGDPAPTRVPSNATIRSASLTVTLADDIDDPLQGYDFYLYRMTRDWNAGSTWNSLAGGVQVGVDTDPTRLATFSGDNDPNYEWGRTLDVLPAVQAWLAGNANYGFAIVPERVSWGDDGIELHAAEASDVAIRPALDIEFEYPVLNAPPVVTAPLTANQALVNEGSIAVLTVGASDPNPNDPLIFTVNDLDIGYATGSGTISYDWVFADEGIYTLVATVSDDEVTVPAGETIVAVQNLPPIITSIDLPATATAGTFFSYAVHAVDPGPLDVLSFAWDLDDDGVFDDAFAVDGEWSFELPGVYAIAVEVRDDDGGVSYDTATIEISASCPGDLDGDAMTGFSDFSILAACWGAPCGDLTGDGMTGFDDFSTLAADFGCGQ